LVRRQYQQGRPECEAGPAHDSGERKRGTVARVRQDFGNALGVGASGGKGQSEMNEHYDLIQTVQLTEKQSLLTEKLNKYVFRVSPRANKIQIKQAIERLFNKKVVAVNTCNYAGKKKRERRADFGRKPHWKKAIVTLKEGEKIDLV